MESLLRCKPLLGTYVEIKLTGDMNQSQLIALSDMAFAEIEKVGDLMSFHDPNSELSKINREAHIKPQELSFFTRQVIEQALLLSQMSDGIFDITITPGLVAQGLLPDHGFTSHDDVSWQDISVDNGYISFAKPLSIDMGGIAKGFAVDKALSVLKSQPVNVMVNAGGDLAMNSWQGERVAIRCNNDKKSLVDVEMKNAALATSANYYSNGKSPIICPISGSPVIHNKVVSVFAPNCMLADALTKVVFVNGAHEALFNSFNAEAMILEPSNRWLRKSYIKSTISPHSSCHVSR